MAEVQYGRGQLTEALESYREFLARAQELAEAYPEHVVARNDLAIAYQWNGVILADLEQYEPAMENFRQAVAVLEGWLQDDPQADTAQSVLAETYLVFGHAQAAAGQTEPARVTVRRALELSEAMLRRGSQRADALRSKGNAYHQLAKLDLAQAVEEDTLRDQRVRYYSAARDSLVHSREVFIDMSERGLLLPSEAGLTDEIDTEIGKCDAALEHLGAPDELGQPGDNGKM